MAFIAQSGGSMANTILITISTGLLIEFNSIVIQKFDSKYVYFLPKICAYKKTDVNKSVC